MVAAHCDGGKISEVHSLLPFFAGGEFQFTIV